MADKNGGSGGRGLAMLWCAFAGCVLVFLLLPAFQQQRVGYRSSCKNKLKQLGVAFQLHHDDHEQFPASFVLGDDGSKRHSWRVALLPYLEEKKRFDKFNLNEPWNSPANLKVASPIPDAYRCPSSMVFETDKQAVTTDYVAVVGANTAWPVGRGSRARDITDGTSNTLLVIERHNSGISWPEPRDASDENLARTVTHDGHGLTSNHRTTDTAWFSDNSRSFARVLLADGSVRDINEGVDPRVLSALITARGGDNVGDR